MILVRLAMLAALAGVACHRGSPPAPAPVLANTVEPVDPGIDPACAADCRARHRADEGSPLAGYCDELCGPITEANPDCLTGCERAHEPAGRYGDDGEYEPGVDERDQDQIASDHRSCLIECLSVPTVSGQALDACTAACVEAGSTEMYCGSSCDPDPYDDCRYMPCD